MAIDPTIARGVNPIGGDLPQIAQMLYQRKQQEQEMAQREQLLQQNQQDRAMHLEDRQLRLDDRKQAQTDEQQKQEMASVLARMDAGDPSAAQFALQKISQTDPNFAKFAQADPEHAAQAARQVMRQALGITDKPPGALYKVDQGGKPMYAPADQAQGMTPWQEPDKPNEPPRPTLANVTLDDGSTQQQWLNPGEAAGVPVGAPQKAKKNPASQTAEIQLSNQFTQDSKQFDTVASQYRRVLAVSAKPSAANDYALIYAFAKIQDPTSVVRESEFATAAKTGAFGETVKAAVTKVANGETLTAVQRADFVNAAKTAYKAQERQWLNSVAGPAHQKSKSYDLEWGNIWHDYRVKESAAPAAKHLSPEEARKLPAGTRFTGTDGIERVKH